MIFFFSINLNFYFWLLKELSHSDISFEQPKERNVSMRRYVKPDEYENIHSLMVRSAVAQW